MTADKKPTKKMPLKKRPPKKTSVKKPAVKSTRLKNNKEGQLIYSLNSQNKMTIDRLQR